MIKNALTYLSDLVFPHVCLACEKDHAMHHHLFCIHCAYEITPLNHWYDDANDFTSKFYGRVDLRHGAALYKYTPGSKFQNVIHRLKYQGNSDIGIYLGKEAGEQIIKYWTPIDVIIPVPLHPEKLWARGYNQAERIAQGIREIIEKPILQNALIKTSNTVSQTQYHRSQRLQNVEGLFVSDRAVQIMNKHVLLVDDVLTTGATLEACAQAILQRHPVKISMLTLGMGSLYT